MKIQIISLPRSGSSYLRSMIDFHISNDNYFSISEPFNKEKKFIINEVLHKLKTHDVVLVKNHLNQLLDLEKKYFDKFKEIPWTTFFLMRKNLFNMTISRCISLISGIWDIHDGELTQTLHIDKDFFLYNFEWTLKYTYLLYNNCLSINYKKMIFYEDLFFDNFLDLKTLNLESYYKGQEIITKKNIKKELVVDNLQELLDLSKSYFEKNIYNIDLGVFTLDA